MTSICIRFLFGLTAIISIFVGLEPFLSTIPLWNANLRPVWWGLCGVLTGQWIKNSYALADELNIVGEREVKKFNEQLKLSASFLNAFAIGIIAYAIFQRLNSSEGIFNWTTLIAL
jgi:hypothetical protein